MPVSAARLRQWFAAALIFVCALVAGVYFYARHRVQNALKQVPGKIGIEIQQSAEGFTISKSEQGRTLFKLQASKAVQFKESGRAELHDVTITLYGRDSSRFDQVYGKQFEYDQQSGNVTSQGEVSIDLQSNPQGILNPDQATPRELKNPIHLRTTNLVFNQKTGDAWTDSPLEFRISQASGSAVGARYAANDGVLTLQSQIKIVVNGSVPSTILAQRAVLEKNPREILLQSPHAESPDQQAQSDQLTLFLREDNTLDRAVATGSVRVDSSRVAPNLHIRKGRAERASDTGASTETWSHVSAQRLEVKMGQNNIVQTAVLSGDVRFSNEGPEPSEARAGRALLSFGAKQAIERVHAEQQVKLFERQRAPGKPAQEVEVSAPAMDFFVSRRRLTRAETVGPPEISMSSTDPKSAPARVTADKFIATFDALGQLSQVHGAAHARIVTTASDQTHQSERVSTSDSIDAFFRPGSGIEALVQNGNFHYSAGTQQAFADKARYTPPDQIVSLNGSPRILDTGMETTARSVRLNRTTGDGFADGNVKTSYSGLKPQPDGALLASADPIHVTAQHMTAHKNPATAIYTGNARLWQDANVVEAPSIQFQKDQRTLSADASANQRVSTTLIGTNQSGKATPVVVTAARLGYRDSDRIAHFQGGVTVRSADLTITSNQMDVFLQQRGRETPAAFHPQPGGTAPATPPDPGLAKLDKIVASGSVIITEPNRRATGDQLTYTASDDKFVLTGGPPSIFDAEHGKITGVSLTLFRTDDRVVVEGDSSSPAITRTRVVR
ncbi:MAG TPA: LPS export ABC transporter periplasmic protein LptC [Terriglobales bacterium]